VKVFYTPEQSVPEVDSYSPSAGKPARLVAQWLERWPDRIDLVPPTPVTPEEIALAHDPEFVHEILACRRHNGFGNLSRKVADSLPWTSGSLVSAVQHVLDHGGAACSPTSGFHHARYSQCGGFCTFNGLMVAAMLARSRVERVGILDCDYHYGNGTDDIIAQLKLTFVDHYTTGRIGGPKVAHSFLEELPNVLDQMPVGLLLYQAGADAHNDDPLGGWMSAEQMRHRDRIVFQYCRLRSLPVVWNLAGGYQEDFQRVLDLHHATMEECLSAFE
jgi:acetoin utilization deacetylase AcuC-like enzyme